MPYITKRGFTPREIEGVNVLEAARMRIQEVFDIAQRVLVSFSGCKDSTVVLMLTLEEARKRGRLPLEVVMFDEEIIDPDTTDFCLQVREWPDLHFHWLCLPVRHSLRSSQRTWWWPWDEDERRVWVRQRPDFAITVDEVPGAGKIPPDHINNGFSTFMRMIFDPGAETEEITAEIVGIRTQESFNRTRAIMGAGGHITNRGHTLYVKPIYDWKWTDVWRAIGLFDWPYSQFYEKCRLAGLSPHHQRVAPWGNAAQIRQVKLWPTFYPDFWDRALRRLPELSAQARHGDTKIYRGLLQKPSGWTWQKWVYKLVDDLPDQESRDYWIHHIKNTLKKWDNMTSTPFPDDNIFMEGYGVETLQSWRYLARIISKNDRSGRDKT